MLSSHLTDLTRVRNVLCRENKSKRVNLINFILLSVLLVSYLWYKTDQQVHISVVIFPNIMQSTSVSALVYI